jgi:hypothetical protein
MDYQNPYISRDIQPLWLQRKNAGFVSKPAFLGNQAPKRRTHKGYRLSDCVFTEKLKSGDHTETKILRD